jgi:hypothetical protein
LRSASAVAWPRLRVPPRIKILDTGSVTSRLASPFESKHPALPCLPFPSCVAVGRGAAARALIETRANHARSPRVETSRAPDSFAARVIAAPAPRDETTLCDLAQCGGHRFADRARTAARARHPTAPRSDR